MVRRGTPSRAVSQPLRRSGSSSSVTRRGPRSPTVTRPGRCCPGLCRWSSARHLCAVRVLDGEPRAAGAPLRPGDWGRVRRRGPAHVAFFWFLAVATATAGAACRTLTDVATAERGERPVARSERDRGRFARDKEKDELRPEVQRRRRKVVRRQGEGRAISRDEPRPERFFIDRGNGLRRQGRGRTIIFLGRALPADERSFLFGALPWSTPPR